jgi:hypothetical protein
MHIQSITTLAKLSTEELIAVFTDARNTRIIRDIALKRWLILDELAFQASIARMRALIDAARREFAGADTFRSVRTSRRKPDAKTEHD